MPTARFVKSTEIGDSFRINKIKGMFDMPDAKKVEKLFDVSIPIEGKEWQIGLIVGSSGSGKTTIAKECFKDFAFFDGFSWGGASIIEEFPKAISTNDIIQAFNAVGLSSAPDWLKPFSVLSNGQKMRAEIARLALESTKPFIYDEFTSVVDRQVAKVSSFAIAKYVRKTNKRFIAVSCHRDIIEWLTPDWIFDTDKNEFSWGRLRCRPKIEIDIRKADKREWQLFKSHHYLSHDLNPSAQNYIAEINSVPVAWCSVLHFPHPRVRNLKTIHRLVVRPDYQGLGVGAVLLDFVADEYRKKGFRVKISTSLAVFSKSMARRKTWKLVRQGYVSPSTKRTAILAKTFSTSRASTSFEYIGHGNET